MNNLFEPALDLPKETNPDGAVKACLFQAFETKGKNDEEGITLCGDNCLACPRYIAKSDEELKYVAELWHRVGWRNEIVSVNEMICSGCSTHKQCHYQLVNCVNEHGVKKCNECTLFPCGKIKDMLERSMKYEEICREKCAPEEFQILKKAFFEKEENLKK